MALKKREFMPESGNVDTYVTTSALIYNAYTDGSNLAREKIKEDT